MIYFLRAGATDAVKIGKADDVPSRIREIQGGNHETLALLREIDGGFAQERWLHNHFAASHIAREWFRYSPEMLTVHVPDLVVHPASHRAILDLWPSANDMASDLNVDMERVRKWRYRRIPSDWWAPIVAASEARGWPVSLSDFVGGA